MVSQRALGQFECAEGGTEYADAELGKQEKLAWDASTQMVGGSFDHPSGNDCNGGLMRGLTVGETG